MRKGSHFLTIILKAEPFIILRFLAEAFHWLNFSFRMLFFDPRLFSTCLFGWNVSIYYFSHIICQFFLSGQHLKQSIPLSNQIAIIDSG